MASSLQGMAFTAGDHLSLENKENETFSWHDTADEPNAGDFFEQYVMLDGTDSGSPTGGGESFHELTEAPDMPAFSPPAADSLPSHLGQQQTSGRSITNQVGSDSHGVPAYTTQSFQPHHHHRQQQQQQQSQSNRQTRGRSDILHHHHHQHHHTTMEQNDLSMSTYELSGGGSISDSELLKLEGLTMRSPRVNLPPTSASVPPSPNSHSTSPRKGGRLEAIYAKIRNKAATLQGKSKQQAQQSAQLDMLPPAISTAQMGSPAAKATGKSKPNNLQIKKDHPPLSPPLTGSMADLSHQGAQGPNAANSADNDMQFVNGFLDDPFFDPSSLLGSMPQTNGGVGPSTPLHTPLLNTAFTSAGGVPSQPAIVWQLGPDGKTLWSPASMEMPRTTDTSSFLAGPDGPTPGDGWWNDPDAMDTTDNTGMGDVDAAIFQQQQAGRSMNNAALNLAMQQLQQHQNGGSGGFEYPLPPGAAEDFAASGLMIHMPQPRTPTSAVLNTSYFPGGPNGNMSTQNGEMSGTRQTRGGGGAEQQQSSKRPKPRAPSSGARYHHHHPSGAMTSPRKTRAASGSGASGGGGAGNGRTTPSPSPTPGEGSGSHPRRLHRRSASMNTLNNQGITAVGADNLGPTHPAAIRKRRSWTGRRLGATEAAVAAAAVASGGVPSVPAVPADLLSPHQQQQGRNNVTRRVSSTSSLAAAANTTNNRTSRQQQQQQQMVGQNQQMLRNNRSMPQLTLQVPPPPPVPQLPTGHFDGSGRAHSLHPSSYLQLGHMPPHHPQGSSSSSSRRAQASSSSSSKRSHHERRHSSHRSGHGANTNGSSSSKSKNGSSSAGGSGGAGLGFVNFTPQDHNILMTGVAPSGSSKTKARREKEAAEKQRRLSEAVLKAVAAAGGDLAKLEQEGIMLS